MEKKVRAFLSAALVCLLLCAQLPMLADAENTPGADVSIGPSEIFADDGCLNVVYRDPDGNLLDISTKDDRNPNRAAGVNLPSSYDLRTEDRVTSVKSQNPGGTCWAFGAIGAVESNMITNGYATASSVDYSEDHLIWFTFTTNDKYGDGPISMGSGSDENSPYNCGGYWDSPVYTMVNWWGAEEDSNAPYSTNLNANGHYPESQRTASYAHLQGAKLIAKDHNATLTRMDEIKSSVMTNGGCTISYYHNDASNRNASHYQISKTDRTNHTVLLVGWDDNYSKSNFRSEIGTSPSQDGAWLIKNSWGPNSISTKNGYMWISYYDPSVRSVTSFNMEPTTNYDHMYGYNGFAPLARYWDDRTSLQYANVFTSPEEEILQAVGLWTMQDDIQYTIKIYRGLPANATDPTSGSLVGSCTTTGHADREGYYTVELKDSIRLGKNERYAVVVSITAGSHNYLYGPFEWYNWTFPNDIPFQIAFSSKQGESFINFGSKWEDACVEGYNNALINTYTKDAYSDFLRFSPATVQLEVGDSIAVNAITARDNQQVTLRIGEVKSFCTVTADETKGFVITANAVGSGTIYGSMTSDGKEYTAELPVTVSIPGLKTLTSISIQSMPKKTVYLIGEDFDKTGLVIQAAYSDNTTAVVSAEECKLTGFSSSSVGTKTINVSYTENGVTQTTSFTVVVDDHVDSGVRFSPSSVLLEVGQKTTVSVTIPSGGSFELQTGSISSICSVGLRFTGSGQSLILTGMNEGYCSVTVTSVVGGTTYTGTLPITVKKPADYSDYEYTISNGEATITAYKGTASTLNIPAVIDGYTVTAIGDRAIYDSAKDLAKVVAIPDTVRTIGETAFYNCQQLEKLTLSEGLQTIGAHAFMKCQKLKSVSIPSTVTSIGRQAFSDCTVLESVQLNIASDTLNLASFAFLNCPSLKTIEISSSNIEIEGKALGYTYDYDKEIYGSTGLTIRGFTGSPAYAYYQMNSDNVKWAPLNRTLLSITVKQKPAKMTYQPGEPFDPSGIAVKALYSDNSTRDVTDSVQYSGFSSSEIGSCRVTVSYTENGVTKSALPFTVSIVDSTNDPTFSMAHVSCNPGETVVVPVTISNNPGLCTARLLISYDSNVLELEGAENGNVFAGGFQVGGDKKAIPYSVLWESATDPTVANGTLVRFTFKVKETAAPGSTIAIKLDYEYEDTLNYYLNPVWFLTQDGSITVTDRIPGDVNGDKKVNLVDAALISRYVVGGWSVTLNESNADVNADGKVNLVDAALISRYVVGGWGVVLK